MSILEDAFALARSGEHHTVSDIAKALKLRGYAVGLIQDHLSGKQIRSELSRACRQATIAKAQVSRQAPVSTEA